MKKIIMILITLMLLSSVASAATLNVGPHERYKTIQSAVNAAQNGDTIKVASGTYKETVTIDKDLTILGARYPKVNGFYYAGGSGTINGFSIQKYGFESMYAGGATIRNNYFYNCGITLGGGQSSHSFIINNQIIGGTISLSETNPDVTIKGNIISKSKYGLYIGDDTCTPTVSGNTFKNCKCAVYFYNVESNPGRLDTFTGNKYIKNKVNIGWGMDPL